MGFLAQYIDLPLANLNKTDDTLISILLKIYYKLIMLACNKYGLFQCVFR